MAHAGRETISTYTIKHEKWILQVYFNFGVGVCLSVAYGNGYLDRLWKRLCYLLYYFLKF